MKYESMFIDQVQTVGDEMVLSFQNTYGGIIAKGDTLLGFEISEDGSKYENADARIDADKIIVSAEGVKAPSYVRYAWTNFGKVNIYNQAGLPLAPFQK